MAIDTTGELLAVLSLGKPGFTLPLADGAFDSADLYHLLGLYEESGEAEPEAHGTYAAFRVYSRAGGRLSIEPRAIGRLVTRSSLRGLGSLSVVPRCTGTLRVLPRSLATFKVEP